MCVATFFLKVGATALIGEFTTTNSDKENRKITGSTFNFVQIFAPNFNSSLKSLEHKILTGEASCLR